LTSSIYGYDNEVIILVLASAINSMISSARSTTRDIPLELTKRRYIKITPKSWFWKVLTDKVVAGYGSLDGLPSEAVTNFHLLYPLGAGITAKSYLACDLNGKRCCLKLFNKSTIEPQDVPGEARRWRTIWSNWFSGCSHVRSLTLSNRTALLMPFFLDPESDDVNLESKVRAAAFHMARQGFEHVDLKGKRHVKAVPSLQGREDRVIFIDLGRVKLVNKNDMDEVNGAAERMVNSVFPEKVEASLAVGMEIG
jgi:hypothetical protein